MFKTELLISILQTYSFSNVCISVNDNFIHSVAAMAKSLGHSWFVSFHTQLPIHQQIWLDSLWKYVPNQCSSHYLLCSCPTPGTIISCLDNSKQDSRLPYLPSCSLFSKSGHIIQLSKEFSLKMKSQKNPHHGVPITTAFCDKMWLTMQQFKTTTLLCPWIPWVILDRT